MVKMGTKLITWHFTTFHIFLNISATTGDIYVPNDCLDKVFHIRWSKVLLSIKIWSFVGGKKVKIVTKGKNINTTTNVKNFYLG